jgi:predicted NAD-dependent protein-ADP-ribosyltransferase YbiA (DUF1768 family)
MLSPYLYFNSAAQQPWHLLSNFSAATLVFTQSDICAGMRTTCPHIDAWMQDRMVVFPSSEHLWQALKATTREAFVAFAVGGRCSGAEVLLGIYGDKGLDKWRWWMRKGNMGIAAKLAANPKRAVVLDLVGRLDYSRERLAADVERDIWLTILRLKFKQSTTHRRALLETKERILIEFDKSATRASRGGGWVHWGGMWSKETQCVVGGENVMGGYLMEIRAELAMLAAQ